MTLYDLMRTIHMALRHETRGLNPRFEMGPHGRRIWVTYGEQSYEVTLTKVDHVPEHLAQAGL